MEVDVASILDCENGGLTLINYIDHNLNGMRDDEEEVKSTRNICNGNDGKDGTNGVGAGIIVKPALTSACIAGGINVTSFVDTNNNGSLDSNESITSVSTVCNGVDGNDGESSQITATKATPTQCSNGGVVYTTSTDFSDPVSTVICNGIDGANGSNGTNSYITQSVASSSQCPTGGTVITTSNDNSEPVFSIICNGANGSNGKDGQSAYITTTIASPFQCSNGGVVISTWTDATNPSNEVICNGTNGTNANINTKTASADQCANGGVLITNTSSSGTNQNIICNGVKGEKGDQGDMGTTPTFITGYVGPLVTNKNYSACHHDFIYFPATGSASNGWLLFRHQKNGAEDQGIGSTGFNVWNVDITNFNLVSEVNSVTYCNLTYDPKAFTLKYTVVDKNDGLSGKTGTISLK